MVSFAEITSGRILYNLVHLRQLIFETTDACNLCCKYCAYSDLYDGYDKRENLKFPFHRAKLIIDYLYALWGENILKDALLPVNISFYGGEPTLNMPFIQKVIDYVEHLPPIGRAYNYSMTTNAMLLDKYMDFFIEKDFDLLISLDGDRVGQSYRVDKNGNSSFDQVIQNVERLRQKAPDFFEAHVSFNSVIHNKNEVESTYTFIKNRFGKETMCAPLSTVGVRGEKLEEFNMMYNDIVDSIKRSQDSSLPEDKLFITNPQIFDVLEYMRRKGDIIYDNYSQLLVDKNKVPHSPTGTCVPFSKKMFVTVKGRILQCEKIDHKFSLGIVDDEKVVMDISGIAKQYNYYISKYLSHCKKCALRCQCPVCIYEVNDNILCPSYITKQELDKLDAKKLEYLSSHPELYRRILEEIVIK